MAAALAAARVAEPASRPAGKQQPSRARAPGWARGLFYLVQQSAKSGVRGHCNAVALSPTTSCRRSPRATTVSIECTSHGFRPKDAIVAPRTERHAPYSQCELRRPRSPHAHKQDRAEAGVVKRVSLRLHAVASVSRVEVQKTSSPARPEIENARQINDFGGPLTTVSERFESINARMVVRLGNKRSVCLRNWRRRPDLNRGWRFCSAEDRSQSRPQS